jgi:hypothetical protein
VPVRPSTVGLTPPSSIALPEKIDGSGADGLAAQKVLATAIESLENESVVYVR